MINERKLTENELEQRKVALKGLLKNKRALVKKYGKDAEKVMYGIATKQAKNKVEKMNLENLRSMIKDALVTSVEEQSPFVLAADAARDAGEKEFEFPKGSGKMHPVTIKQDIKEKDLGEGAKEEGEMAATKGKQYSDNPYKKGTQDYLDWSKGHNASRARKADIGEDLDIGHQDNEPKMLKSELIRAAKMIKMLYKAIDKYDQGSEVDFPQWWQKKIIQANAMLDSAFDYLDGQEKVAQVDAMLDEDHSGNPNDKYIVRPCKNKQEPWAVWEGEVRVKGFATKEEAQAFADKKNKEQGLEENQSKSQFQVGDKVTYLGHPGEITKVNKEMTGAITYNVAYNKGEGKTKATNIYNKGGEIKALEEKLTKRSSVEKHIEDFKDSDSPQFKGKSQEKRRKMAVAAYLSKQDKK